MHKTIPKYTNLSLESSFRPTALHWLFCTGTTITCTNKKRIKRWSIVPITYFISPLEESILQLVNDTMQLGAMILINWLYRLVSLLAPTPNSITITLAITLTQKPPLSNSKITENATTKSHYFPALLLRWLWFSHRIIAWYIFKSKSTHLC